MFKAIHFLVISKLLVTSVLVGLLAFGHPMQTFAQDSSAPADAVSQSDLIGSQVLDTPYGVMAIDNDYPTDDTVAKLFAQRNRQRATEVYLWSLPIVQFQIWSEQQAKVFGSKGTDVVVLNSFHEKGGVTTGNATTPYLISFFNLAETGPLVIDFPSGPYAGGILDWWERTLNNGAFFNDGSSGVKSAKYLLLGPEHTAKDHEGKGYSIVQSPTNKVFFGNRILKPGAEALAEFQKSLMVYPLGSEPKPVNFITGIDKPWSGTPPTGLDYFKAVHRAIQDEPVLPQDKPYMAFLTSLGIEDGKPFNPNPQMAKLLAEGANIGELMARANSMEHPHAKSYWQGTHWHRLLDFPLAQVDEKRSYIDERAAWFYEAVTSSGQMQTNTPGSGQVYLSTKRDSEGNVLKGGETYRMRVPANAPAEQFWAVTLYAEHSRLFVVTAQKNANLDSRNESLKTNDDGSVDIYFGPNTTKVPADMQNNWIQTKSDEGWFPYFRLYAPKKEFFEETWAMGDIQRISR